MVQTTTDSSTLGFVRMIIASVRYSWRVSAAVALGVATATAVIVGALLVGDSMRGSLRGLTLERLGKIESAIFPGAFFSADHIVRGDEQSAALILFNRATIEFRGEDGRIRSRAGDVQIIGCDEKFWSLDTTDTKPKRLPDDNSIILNAQAASALGVEVGDEVTIRLPVEQAVPADSPLGRRETESEGLPRMKVAEIVPNKGLGIFSVLPSQAAPKNAFLNRETIGAVLERKGQSNAILFDKTIAEDELNVDLEDLGLVLKRVRQNSSADGSGKPVFDYYSLTSDRLLLSDTAVTAIRESFSEPQVTKVTTYLANAIELLEDDGSIKKMVPYSTITAIDSTPTLPLDFSATSERNGGAVPLALNSWTANQLGVVVGAKLRVAYYEPEIENGDEIERSFDAIVTSIVPITKPATPFKGRSPATFDEPPTVYNDPDLTPIVPGVTDQDSIEDWDLPFALDRKTDKADDEYWADYRLTPKAFLPLDDGERLFGSRFGRTTGLRFTSDAADDIDDLRAKIRAALHPKIGELGWSPIQIRENQIKSSKGTTPFDALFLSLSFFVIMAAVMLIAMLFRLGLIERTKQFGTLLAVGWSPKKVGWLALGEGLAVAGVGVVLGIIGGIGYAWFVLWALRSWWVGAVTVPFLTFHWTMQSLLIGAVAGWVVAAIALWVTVRSITRAPAQSLLSGADMDKIASRSSAKSVLPKIAVGTAVSAIAIAAFGATTGGQIAAGAFVGSGMLLLVAALIGVYVRLSRPKQISGDADMHSFTIGSLAASNASRRPLRSTMTIGLMAAAAFLVIAISAFRLQPTERGTGGFTLIGQTAQPIARDLRDATVKSELLGSDAKEFNDTTIAPMRMRLGQDASCNNLYQATRPTVLGVPDSFAQISDLPGFDWAGTAVVEEGKSPWSLLGREASGSADDPIPVVIDQNTAMWSLQMTGGVGQVREFEYETGKPIAFKVVGLLANSVLQGRLLIGESNFTTLFPEISGYQFFLFATKPERSAAAAAVLEDRLSAEGIDVEDSAEVLSGMMAVQNTYLRTFQSLGGLGLLLGTIGLAVSQLRSVLERRKELAVMRAIGFTRRRLATAVMNETAALLLIGIGCGAVCAAIAVIPHALINGLKPPIVEPILFVVGIILFGLVAGLVAVRRVIRMPLLESLRAD